MNLQDKIKQTKEIAEKEQELIYQIKGLEEQLKEEQQNCVHIGVLLHKGNNANENICRCLLCGARQSFLAKYQIDANAYLKEFDTTTYEGCDKKWEWLCLLAQGYLYENPNMDAKELTNSMNQDIRESILYDDGPKKELVLNEKIG